MLNLLFLMACGGNTVDSAPPRDTGTIPRLKPEVTTLGDPDWEIGLLELFHAPLDPSVTPCLFEGNHRAQGANWLPGDPHEGPYGAELTEAVARCGYQLVEDSTFSVEEWSDPNGIWMGLVITAKAGGVQGSTPDYSLGDLIQDNRFPLVYDSDVRRDEVIVDLGTDGSFPSAYDLGYFVNGHSHVVMAFGSNQAQMPAGASAPGEYSWRLSLRDATSANQGDQGYDVVLPFTVVE